jgi:arsenate reductase
MVIIYHNTQCSKSREAFCLLEEKTEKFKVVDYLNQPLTHEELTDLIKKLGIQPEELIRKTEPVFQEYYKGKTLTGTQWIAAMVKHPILIERPIVVNTTQLFVAHPKKYWNF